MGGKRQASKQSRQARATCKAALAGVRACIRLLGPPPMLGALRLQEWGVNLKEHEKPSRATLAYLNYIHAIAANPAEVGGGAHAGRWGP